MYPSVIHEGEVVESPTGRKWRVLGWEDGAYRVELVAMDGSGDTVSLHPHYLRYVPGGRVDAGASLDELELA